MYHICIIDFIQIVSVHILLSVHITKRLIVPYRSPPTGGGTFQANVTRVESKILPPSTPVCSFFRSVNASGFAPPRFSYEFGKTVTST